METDAIEQCIDWSSGSPQMRIKATEQLAAIETENAALIAALQQIANYGHSDKCDGWYDDKLGRIDPNTGRVYRFNSCPIYECDCGGNTNGVNQWDIAQAALDLFGTNKETDEKELMMPPD